MGSKTTHGGKRPGAGRPKSTKEATTTVAFRVPVSHVNAVKELIKDYFLRLTNKAKSD